MNNDVKRIHYFHADAVALGGFLERPIHQSIPLQGSLALPPAGGYGSLRVEKFRLDGVLSFESAHSQVSGSRSLKPGHGWTTLATAAVEGLNVLDVVTADRVVAQIVTEHPLQGYVPTVSFLGTKFENLKINGYAVNDAADLNICERGKGQENAPFLGDKAFLDKIGQADAAKRGFALCSMVKTPANGPARGGHVFEVAEFGSVRLAELLIDCNSFQLTMIRLDLGCAGHGSVTVAKTGSNGTTAP